jgi:hypothetical protein
MDKKTCGVRQDKSAGLERSGNLIATTPGDRTLKMTEEKKDEERETVAIGPLKAQLSRENMRMIVPYVGVSLIILTVASVIGAVFWGIK